ncbi:MAG: hypothetical protein WA951_14890, partial [Leeuwenhoekiella sp.]
MNKVLMYALVLLCIACGENKPDNQTDNQLIEVDSMSGKKESQKHVSAERSAVIDDELTSSVYDQYNKIKTALVNSDSKSAKMIAVELLKSSG